MTKSQIQSEKYFKIDRIVLPFDAGTLFLRYLGANEKVKVLPRTSFHKGAGTVRGKGLHFQRVRQLFRLYVLAHSTTIGRVKTGHGAVFFSPNFRRPNDYWRYNECRRLEDDMYRRMLPKCVLPVRS